MTLDLVPMPEAVPDMVQDPVLLPVSLHWLVTLLS